ncbi:MAG: hypothetical protein ACRD1E_00460 [Terriglobales bacterium]
MLRRTQRTLGERLRGRAAAYECSHCGQRRLLHPAKHCWRCGTDLDRRRRQTVPDRLAAVLRLWPYSCRRCGKRRYRWGMRAA